MSAGKDPLELFSWYYLGLSPRGEHKFVNGNQVAQFYNWSVDELMKNLKRHRIDPDTVLNTDFPMARYQVDMQMAAEAHGPEHLLELAGRIFAEFRQRVGTARDWLAEIERERAEERARRRV
jgi:hypothetical protein